MEILARKGKLAALLLAAALWGCAAPTQKMTDQDRARVKTVAIGDKVQTKGQLFLLAPGSSIGLMFGAVGGALSAGAVEDDRKVFADFLSKNGISIESIVREEVERALAASGKLAVVATADASTPRVDIFVMQHGFGVPTLVSSTVVPVLSVKCDMVDVTGKVIWSAGDRIGPSIANPVDPTTWTAMRDNPKLIEEQWRKAARLIAQKIVGEL